MNKFLWLVRRELWEARVVWMAPVIVAVIVIGGSIGAATFSHNFDINGMDAASLAKMNEAIRADRIDSVLAVGISGVILPFYIALFFTQFFYAIDAIYGERRDRSILFFKSLPVSDPEAVLSKLVVASVIMPAATALAAFAGQLGVCAVLSLKVGSSLGLQAHLWSPSMWGDALALNGYVLLAEMLWSLPVVGYSFVVSAWARRAPIGIAVLVPFGLTLAEWIVLHTRHVLDTVLGQAFGLFNVAFRGHTTNGFGFVLDKNTFDTAHAARELVMRSEFLVSAELWTAVAVGVALITASVAVRRYRDATL